MLYSDKQQSNSYKIIVKIKIIINAENHWKYKTTLNTNQREGTDDDNDNIETNKSIIWYL